MLLYFCTFWKMDLIIRNFLNDNKQFFIFFQKKAFLIFRKIETPKKFLIFQEMGPSYILGNRIPKNWGGNSSSSKWKKTPLKCFLYFEKRTFIVTSSKTSYISRENFQRLEKQTKVAVLKDFLVTYDTFSIK